MSKVNVYDEKGNIITTVEYNPNLSNGKGLTVLRNGSYVLYGDDYGEIVTKDNALNAVLKWNIELLHQKRFDELKNMYLGRMEVTDNEAWKYDIDLEAKEVKQ